MIELGVFSNGAGDLGARKIKSDGNEMYLVDGDLHAIQDMCARSLQAQVRQGILCDQLGLDYWFQSEHHFQPEGAEFSPNPLIVQAALAARTKRIRLGQAANIITWWHPVRLAEQLAMLDIISGGRVEAGIARGYQPRENETFGQIYGSSIQDQERNRSYFEEAYDILIKCWTEDSFQYRGEFFSLPPSWTKWNHKLTIEYFSQEGIGRSVEQVLSQGPPDAYSAGNAVEATTTTLQEISVLPHPLQKPHPQVWQPVTSERSIRWAAKNGVNGYYPAVPLKMLTGSMGAYWDEAEKNNWPDLANRGEFKYGWDAEQHRGVCVQKFMHAVDKGIGDKKRFEEGLRMQWDYLVPFGFGAIVPGRPDPMAPVRAEDLFNTGLAICGSKEELVEGILKTKEDGGFVNDYFFVAEVGLGGFAPAEIEEQIAYYAEEVAPILRRECGGGPARGPVDVDYNVEAPALEGSPA
jgi:alkanesulfonate monooxygenase SsuD/methylene tetrahydromethanopterin reductase-like flavin-dependent oxidoreductase (luciferase family)